MIHSITFSHDNKYILIQTTKDSQIKDSPVTLKLIDFGLAVFKDKDHAE